MPMVRWGFALMMLGLAAGCADQSAEVAALQKRVATLEKRVNTLEGRGGKAKAKSKGKAKAKAGKAKAGAGRGGKAKAGRGGKAKAAGARPAPGTRGGVGVRGDAVKVRLTKDERSLPLPAMVPPGIFKVEAQWAEGGPFLAVGDVTVEAGGKYQVECAAAQQTCEVKTAPKPGAP